MLIKKAALVETLTLKCKKILTQLDCEILEMLSIIFNSKLKKETEIRKIITIVLQVLIDYSKDKKGN
jgi:hypothetical protein